MGVFLPERYVLTSNLYFWSNSNQNTLIIELICESVKIYALRNPESTCRTAYQCFYICLNINSYNISLMNTCLQNNMWAEATLGEFAISLVRVISFQPAKVESEYRNFSEEQPV